MLRSIGRLTMSGYVGMLNATISTGSRNKAASELVTKGTFVFGEMREYFIHTFLKFLLIEHLLLFQQLRIP